MVTLPIINVRDQKSKVNILISKKQNLIVAYGMIKAGIWCNVFEINLGGRKFRAL